MMKSAFLSTLVCFLATISVFAQKKTTRATSAIHFSEAWVWNYTNASGEKGSVMIYREPKSGSWLLTKDDAGLGKTDEMTRWFLLQPNGEILQAYDDPERNGRLKLHRLRWQKKAVAHLPGYYKPTGKTARFGTANWGYKPVRGRSYNIAYQKTNEKTTVYLADSTLDWSALFAFNSLDMDAKLPIRFPVDIPPKKIPLSEETTGAGWRTGYTFEGISSTEYDIDLSVFRK